MGFSQLYYTSCERGLSGHAGYQFNAATPGVAQEVMAEVEVVTAYDPPRSVAYDSDAAQIARSPVNLCYLPGAPGVLANVVFVGNDYSRRFGNYFAHALVSDDVRRDLAGVLPIELWGAGLWTRRPADDPVLPTVERPHAGDLDRQFVADFLAAHRGARHLPALLTAVDRALVDPARRVVIVERDAEAVAHWIAAVSYLMPAEVVTRMSFATYEHEPRYSRMHVVGTVAETAVDRSAFDAYHLFDLLADEVSPVEPHPLAELLVYVGVESAPELWHQVDALADGSETGLDGWHAVVLASMGADGADADLVARWLSRHAHRLGAATVARIGFELDVRACPPDLLTELAEVTRAVGAHEFAARVEEAWVEVFLGGDLGGPGLVPRAPSARERAAALVTERLKAASPPMAARLLDWARQCGIEVDGHVLRRVGADTFGPALLAEPFDEGLATALREWPGMRPGVVAHLVAHGDLGRLAAVLRSAAADLLDLRRHPAMSDAATVADARLGTIPRTLALVRVSSGAVVDEALLAELWPDRGWDHDEASLLLRDLAPESVCVPPLRDRFDAALRAEPTDGEVFDLLCAQVREHPLIDVLPAATRTRVHDRFRMSTMVDGILRAEGRDAFERALPALVRSYGSSGQQRRAAMLAMLLDRLPTVDLTRRALLVLKLDDLRTAYVADAVTSLGQEPDPQLAADLLHLSWQLRKLSAKNVAHANVALKQVQDATLTAIRKWRRRRVRVAIALLRNRGLKDAAEWFDSWADDQTGNRIGRFIRKRLPSKETT